MSQEKTAKLVVRPLESGSVTPDSGVYRWDHNGCSEKLFWLREGEVLPPCPRCGKKAVFLLEQKVQHISEDPDFNLA